MRMVPNVLAEVLARILDDGVVFQSRPTMQTHVGGAYDNSRLLLTMSSGTIRFAELASYIKASV